VAAGTPAELKRRVGGTVIETHAHRRSDVAGIARALAALDHGSPQVDEPTLRVTVAVGPEGDPLRRAVNALHDLGLEVDDIALRQPTLDEVFLALTGRSSDQPPTAASDDAA
jgi:ABC-2 type transport system ATP-binding protein